MELINDEQVAFCDILSQKAMRDDGEYHTGYKLRDTLSQAQLVNMYSIQAETSRQGYEHYILTHGESLSTTGITTTTNILTDTATIGGLKSEHSLESYRREAVESRAERDVWSLLNILTRSELLTDLDNNLCNISLSNAMKNQITERSTIEEIENVALSNDERIKKGR